jgi:hypothetical protein
MESQGSPTNPSLTGDKLSGCSRHCCCRASNAAASMLHQLVTSLPAASTICRFAIAGQLLVLSHCLVNDTMQPQTSSTVAVEPEAYCLHLATVAPWHDRVASSVRSIMITSHLLVTYQRYKASNASSRWIVTASGSNSTPRP